MNTYELLNKLINPKYTTSRLFINVHYIFYQTKYLGYITYLSHHVELTVVIPSTATHTIIFDDPEYQTKVNNLLDKATTAK